MAGSARIGLVGCGRWGSFVLRDLVALGCEVTRRRSLGGQQRGRGRGRRGNASSRASDELPVLDGIVVATPTPRTQRSSSTRSSTACRSSSRSRSPTTSRADRLAEAARRPPLRDGQVALPPRRRAARADSRGTASSARSSACAPCGSAGETRTPLDARLDLPAARALDRAGDPRRGARRRPRRRRRRRRPSSGSSACSVTIPGTRWRSRRRSSERQTRGAAVLRGRRRSAARPLRDHVQLFRRDELTEQAGERAAADLHRAAAPARARRLSRAPRGGPPPRSSAAEGAAAVRAITELRALMGVPV